jgi:murein DD-endopeptidase MepM/ murein hydrolase activator NlpD
LETQAAFSEYAVPANVSYEAPTLPFDWILPCAGGVTSPFGYRKHPLEDAVKFHYGLDLGAYEGDPISAFADGTVLSVQELDGYGKTVLIQHDGGFSTLYAHCSQTLVETGATVKRGQRIALAGQTGKVTGPHLHFELLYNGSYLNPEFYLV